MFLISFGRLDENKPTVNTVLSIWGYKHIDYPRIRRRKHGAKRV